MKTVILSGIPGGDPSSVWIFKGAEPPVCRRAVSGVRLSAFFQSV